jgi:alkylhydroperoxidase family enzyme
MVATTLSTIPAAFGIVAETDDPIAGARADGHCRRRTAWGSTWSDASRRRSSGSVDTAGWRTSSPELSGVSATLESSLSTPSSRIKELVRLRLGRTHGSGLCNKWNTNDALEAGFTWEAVDAVPAWPEPVDPSHFTDAELAVIRYADQMALQNMDGALSPELYADLRRHFDDGELFELGVTMAVLTGMFKFLFIGDLTPKMAHCPVPGSAGVSSDWVVGPAERLRSVEKLAASVEQ